MHRALAASLVVASCTFVALPEGGQAQLLDNDVATIELFTSTTPLPDLLAPRAASAPDGLPAVQSSGDIMGPYLLGLLAGLVLLWLMMELQSDDEDYMTSPIPSPPAPAILRLPLEFGGF